jgi:hypothetical protein
VDFVVDADPRSPIDFQGQYNTDHHGNKFEKAHQVSLGHHQDTDYKVIMEWGLKTQWLFTKKIETLSYGQQIS